jgi:hypothetical protein
MSCCLRMIGILIFVIGGWPSSRSVMAAWPTITGSVEDDERVDKALESTLAHFAKIQEPDGRFDKQSDAFPGLTGLAAMTFLAKGYVPGQGKYGDTLNRAVDWVLAKGEVNNGTGVLKGSGGGVMYSQGICTLFLTEVSGMLDRARQEKVDKLLPKAVQVILTSEVNGGWSYNPRNDLGDLTKKTWYDPKGQPIGDLSISGWQLMSLRGARLNGAQIPNGAINAAVKYVLNHHDKEEGTFGYRGKSDNAKTLTGAGVLCLELCGQHDEERTRRSARFLMNNYETLPQVAHGNGTYGLYYTSQGLFQLGGPLWGRFSDWMYNYYIGTQKDNGSWGDVKDTAFIALAFAVPYRMLPIYQRDETVDEE